MPALGGPRLTAPELWHYHPLRLAPEEEAFARSVEPGYNNTPGETYSDVVALGSGLLRR